MAKKLQPGLLLRIRLPAQLTVYSPDSNLFINIEVLEDAKVWSLQYRKLEPVFEKHHEVERLGRLLVTHNYLLLDERMKLFAFCTAEERYERLLIQIPDILQRVKLGHVASYLGISQEHLSRIRAGYKK